MPTFFSPVLTLFAIGLLALPILFAMRIVQPRWWASRRARHLALGLLGMLTGAVFLWVVSRAAGFERLVWLGAGVAYIGVLTFLPAAITLPVVAAGDRLLARRKAGALSRRALLSVPALAAATSATGFVQASDDPKVRSSRTDPRATAPPPRTASTSRSRVTRMAARSASSGGASSSSSTPRWDGGAPTRRQA